MPHDSGSALQPGGASGACGCRACFRAVWHLVGGAARDFGTALPSLGPVADRRFRGGGVLFQLMTGASEIALPEIRGRIERNRPLAPISWLRAGGPAEIFFMPADREDLAALRAGLDPAIPVVALGVCSNLVSRDGGLRAGGPAATCFMPADREDLAEFLAGLAPAIPVMPLGVCSNLIIRDGGLKGAAIRLGRGFNSVEALPGHRIRAGAAALDAHVARRAAEFGIAGLEFLRTIPGAIGGAVKMNAGCYGSYLADVLVEAVMIDRQGKTHVLGQEDLGFGYRSSAVPDDAVIVEVVLQGREGDSAGITARMEELLARRAASQPTSERSCGSTFRNPAGHSSTWEEGESHELKAWKLIDDAGCRGLRLGGAQMSPMHPNFLINTGNATAADLENLGEEVRARVLSHSGHDLIWEIRRVGVMLP